MSGDSIESSSKSDILPNPTKAVKASQDKSLSYVQLICSFCKFKKRKCDGENPCSNCKKHNQTCVYFADNDRRRRKYHTDYINYLEGKSEVLNKFIEEFLKDLPELSDAFHQKLSQVIQVSQINAEDVYTATTLENRELDDHLLEMMEEASKLKLDEDDNSRVTNSKSFLNHSNEYDDYDVGQQGSPYSEYTSSTLDASPADEESNNPLSMNGLNIVFKDNAFRLHLTDCFEKYFSVFCHSYTNVLPSVKEWEFSSPVPSKQLLMCSIFAVGAVYSDHPYALRSRKLFVAELEYIAINACRYPLDIYLVLGLTLLSMYELGMGNDSISYLFDSMACSLSQHMGLHISYDETGDSKAASYAPRASPIRSSILWGICLQDRVITTICGVQACIHFKRIIAPAYQTVLGPESDKYVAELYFASQTRLWYIFDRFMDQICSENGDIGDTHQRSKLLETALNSLSEFKNSLPSPLMLTNENNNKFVAMLHYTYYSLICQYHRKFIKITKNSSEELIKNSIILAKILSKFHSQNPFEILPYNSTFLIFSNALVYLIVITRKKDAVYANKKEKEYYHNFRSHFQTCITLLKALSRFWKRPKKDLNILRNMCLQAGIHVPELTDNQVGEEARFFSQFPAPTAAFVDKTPTASGNISSNVSPAASSNTTSDFPSDQFDFDSQFLFQDNSASEFFNTPDPQQFAQQYQHPSLPQQSPLGQQIPYTSAHFQQSQRPSPQGQQVPYQPSLHQQQQRQSPQGQQLPYISPQYPQQPQHHSPQHPQPRRPSPPYQPQYQQLYQPLAAQLYVQEVPQFVPTMQQPAYGRVNLSNQAPLMNYSNTLTDGFFDLMFPNFNPSDFATINDQTRSNMAQFMEEPSPINSFSDADTNNYNNQSQGFEEFGHTTN